MSQANQHKTKPSAKQLKEAYEELDLQPGAGLAEVKEAYRRLARALHPDRHPGTLGVLMRRVNQAYRLLTEHLESQQRARQKTARPKSGPTPPPRRAEKTPPPQSGGLKATVPQPQEQPLPLAGYRLRGVVRAGGDVVYQVEVDGRPRSMELPLRRQRQCTMCQGSGVISKHGQSEHCPACAGRGWVTSSEQVRMAMPTTWRSGQRMVLPGSGQSGRILVELHDSLNSGRDV
jgi:curved DNA-binding protein CbpA